MRCPGRSHRCAGVPCFPVRMWDCRPVEAKDPHERNCNAVDGEKAVVPSGCLVKK